MVEPLGMLASPQHFWKHTAVPRPKTTNGILFQRSGHHSRLISSSRRILGQVNACWTWPAGPESLLVWRHRAWDPPEE
jgi:hypothetical protein